MFKSCLAFIYITVTAFSLTAQATPQNNQWANRANLKETLTEIRGLTNSQFNEILDEQAQLAKEQGDAQKALVLAKIAANPNAYADYMELVDQELQNQSENGIFFLMMVYSGVDCSSVSCLIIATVMSILTLEGKEASGQ